MRWLCNVSAWLGWTMFPRIPFLVCFHIGEAPREIPEGSEWWKKSGSCFAAHTQCYWSADLPHSHEAALDLQLLCPPLDPPSVSPTPGPGQVCVFIFPKKGPSFYRMSAPLTPEVTRTDTGFSPSSWSSCCGVQPTLDLPQTPILHSYSLPDYLPGGLKAPTSDTETTSHTVNQLLLLHDAKSL